MRFPRLRGRSVLVGAAVTALFTLVGAQSAYAAEDIHVGTDYGFAGATFDWAGPGKVSNITLTVADWGCDAEPVYAQFLVIRTNGGSWYTDTKRYDYSGCDTGDSTTYRNLSLSDGYNIKYLRVRICVDGGSCALSPASGANPRA